MSGSSGGDTYVSNGTPGKVFVQNLIFDNNSITPSTTFGDQSLHLTTSEVKKVDINNLNVGYDNTNSAVIVTPGSNHDHIVLRSEDGDIYLSPTNNTVTSNSINIAGDTLRSNATNGTIFLDPNGSTGTVNVHNAMYVTEGKVGIGISTPDSKLHVDGNVKIVDGNLRLSSGDIILSGDIYNTDNSLYFEKTWNKSGNDLYYSTGNVNVGSSNAPTGKLDVVASDGKGLLVSGDAGASVAQAKFSGSTNSVYIKSNNDNSSSYALSIEKSDSSSLLHVRNDGLVGVGTSNPSYGLDVEVSARMNHSLVVGGTGLVVSRDQESIALVGASSSYIGLYPDDPSVRKGYFGYANGAMTFDTESSTRDFVFSGGYMGLKTNNPEYNLTINAGSTNSTSGKGSHHAFGILGSASNHALWMGYDSVINAGYFNTEGNTSLLLQTLGGNVGIGSNNPLGRLDVRKGTAGSSDWEAATFGAQTSVNDIVVIGNYNNRAVIAGKNATMSGDANLVLAPTGGNVGVGVSAPSFKLDVDGNINVTGSIYVNGTSIPLTRFYQTEQNVYLNTGNFGVGTSIPMNGSNLTGIHITRGQSSSLVLGEPINSTYGGFVQTNASKRRIFVSANIYHEPSGWQVPNTGSGYAAMSAVADVGDWGTSIDFFVTNDGTDSINDTRRMVILGNGNVGINVSSPSFKLDVDGDINFTGTLYENGSPFITSQWTTSGSNIYYSSGNVGIGTSSPGAPLQIDTTAYVGAHIKRTSNGGSVMRFETTQGSGYVDIGVDNVAPNLFMSVGGSTRFHIESSTGNVGIGTSSPSQKLHVDGAIRVTSNPSNPGDTTSASFWDQYNVGPTISGAAFSVQTNGTSERLRILSNGNVGIGTSSPNYKLDVSGDINFTGSLYQNGASFTTSQWTTSGSNITFSSGNVGIYGTSVQSPSSKLEIWNNNSGGDWRMIRLYGGGDNTGDRAGIAFGSFGANEKTLGAAIFFEQQAVWPGRTGDLIFATKPYNYPNTTDSVHPTNNERMRMTWNGLIGVGTGAGPDASFHINSGGLLVSNNDSDVSGQGLHLQWNRSGGYGEGWIINNVGAATNANEKSIRFGFTDSGGTVTERLRLMENGNVGIGTTSPSQKLTISDPTTPFLRFERSTATYYDFEIGMNNSADLIFRGGADATGSSLTEFMRIKDNGNVGIGTSSPSSKLTIVPAGTQAGLRVSGEAGTSYPQVKFENSTFGLSVETNNTSSSYYALNIANSSTNIMRIRNDGNVGIGTTSPSSKLHVFSSASGEPLGYFQSNGDASIRLNGQGGEAYIEYMNQHTTTSNAWKSGVNDTNKFELSYGTSGTANSSLYGMTLDTSGNVGINTLSPMSGSNLLGIHINQGTHAALVLGNPISSTYGGYIQTSDSRHRVFIGANIRDDPTTTWTQTTSGKGYAGISVLGDANDWGSNIQFWASNSDHTSSTSLQVRMVVNGDGNVGIGTTSPSYKLHVAGDINFTGTLYQNGSAFSGGGSSVWTTSGSNAYYTSGNVGIGTTSPIGKLHVSSGTSGDCLLILEADTDNNYEDDNPAIWFRQDGGVNQSSISHINNRLAICNNIGLGNGGIAFYTGTTDATGTTPPLTNATEKMTIVPSGNVGIGISSPDTKLHIYDSSSSTAIFLGEDGTTDKSGIVKYLQGDGNGTGFMVIGNWGDDLDNNGAGIVVKKGGNVGVGTISPAYDLDVSGDINLTGTLYANGTEFSSSQWNAVGSSTISHSLSAGFNHSDSAIYVDEEYLVSTDVLYNNYAGLMYIYDLSDLTFNTYVTISGDSSTDGIGSKFSRYNDYLVTTSSSGGGTLMIFKLESGSWVRKQKIKGGAGTYDQWGNWSVSIYGDYIAVGEPVNKYVNIFKKGSGTETWSLEATVSESTALYFGVAVEFYDDATLMIGASGGAGTYNNSVQFYTRSGTTWSRSGTSLNGANYSDFGKRITFNRNFSNYIIVTEGGMGGSNGSYGGVRVFKNTGGTWSEDAALEPPVNDKNNLSGWGDVVSFNGTTLTIGTRKTWSSYSARIFVYNLINGTWTYGNYIEHPTNPSADDRFGRSHGINSTNLFVTSATGNGSAFQIHLYDLPSSSVYYDGNVGIGNSSPAYALDVTGDINFTGTLYQNGSAFSGGGGGSSQWTTSGSDIYYTTGNVGIGTSTISYPLDVRSTANNTARISYSGTSTYPYGLTLGYSSSLPAFTSQTNNLASISVVDSSIGTGYNDGDLIISSSPIGSNGMMMSEERADIRFITNSTSMMGSTSVEAMRISSIMGDSGGIGINVPVDQRLESAITTHFSYNNSVYAEGFGGHHICMQSIHTNPADRSYFWMGYDGSVSTAYINTMQLNGAYGSYATSNLSLQTYTYSPGCVGIGTAEPKAKLHVNGTGDSGTSLASASRKYFIGTQSGTTLAYDTSTSNFGTISIYANQEIVTSSWFISHGTTTYSDARIKKDIVDVEDDSALQTVRLLKPKKYSYIDTISKGTTPVWGFIAQEVAEVLDYSVQKMEKAIPNVYCIAAVVGEDYDILEFSNFDTGNLQYVDGTLMKKLQCKLWDNTEMDIEIAEIVSSSKIRATKPLEKSKCNDKEDQSGSVVDTVFVYGQYVDDFHVLKKDAIFTVSVAALQEIDRRQEADNERIAVLEETNDNLQNELNAAKSEIIAANSEIIAANSEIAAMKDQMTSILERLQALESA